MKNLLSLCSEDCLSQIGLIDFLFVEVKSDNSSLIGLLFKVRTYLFSLHFFVNVGRCFVHVRFGRSYWKFSCFESFVQNLRLKLEKLLSPGCNISILLYIHAINLYKIISSWAIRTSSRSPCWFCTVLGPAIETALFPMISCYVQS